MTGLGLLAICLEVPNPSLGLVPFCTETGAVDGLVAEALAVITSPGRESIIVKELVEEMLVSRRTLERAFRRHFGHGVHDEILSHRLQRAIRSLADRSLNLEQVAARSGFNNVRTLRRAFSETVGLSLRAYRERIRPEMDAI